MNCKDMTREPRKILVTGGGGFLGSAIVRRLVERGDTVRSLSRHVYSELEALGVDQISGDIGDFRAVDEACQGVDTVFHTAAKPGVWGPYQDYYRTNVIGTQNVITACQKHRVSKLIHTSSPSVVFDGTDMEGVDESAPYPKHYRAHYPKTKAIAEQMVIEASKRGLKTVILRPHLIWGPKDNHLVPRIIARANRLVRIGYGIVDTIYIDNAADAHILAANALERKPEISGRIYFLSQGQPVLLWEMVDNILKAAGLDPVKRRMSKTTAWAIGALMEAVYAVFKLKGEPPMTRFLAEELSTSHWFNISAAKSDLGYEPTVSIEEGLRRLESWLRRHN